MRGKPLKRESIVVASKFFPSVDGDFDDYSKPENDDFEDETYDKVEGAEAVRLPVRGTDVDDDDDDEEDEDDGSIVDGIELNSEDEDEVSGEMDVFSRLLGNVWGMFSPDPGK